MTGSAISELEVALAKRFHRRHCIVTGRGASAIFIALKALPVAPTKIVVPATACPSVATAPLYAGWQPVFCDISLRDFNLCPDALRQTLKDHPDATAIMAVHLYGQPAPMREISAIAKSHGAFLIEDAAQAVGAQYEGRPVGSLGDVSIISFGHTKTLDVGWGGAALTDDDDLAARLRDAHTVLPSRPAHLNELFEHWRRIYYAIVPMRELNPAIDALFVPLHDVFRDMYLFKLQDEQVPGILAALGNLENLVASRRAVARDWRNALQHPALHHPALDEGAAPWRYSFMVRNGQQKKITDQLRAAQIDVSNWYPSLHRWYESGRVQNPQMFPNAYRLEREVVNLWTTPNITMDRIEQTSAIIHRILEAND